MLEILGFCVSVTVWNLDYWSVLNIKEKVFVL